MITFTYFHGARQCDRHKDTSETDGIVERGGFLENYQLSHGRGIAIPLDRYQTIMLILYRGSGGESQPPWGRCGSLHLHFVTCPLSSVDHACKSLHLPGNHSVLISDRLSWPSQRRAGVGR